MCDKICALKIYDKSFNIKIDDINKYGKTKLFDEEVKIKNSCQNVCKNCKFNQKNIKNSLF